MFNELSIIVFVKVVVPDAERPIVEVLPLMIVFPLIVALLLTTKLP